MLKISMLALCTVITSLLIKKQSPVTASAIGLSLCLIISFNIINKNGTYRLIISEKSLVKRNS